MPQDVKILLCPLQHLGTDLPFLLIKQVKAEIQLPEGGAAHSQLVEIFAKFLRSGLDGLFGARRFHRVAIDRVMVI